MILENKIAFHLLVPYEDEYTGENVLFFSRLLILLIPLIYHCHMSPWEENKIENWPCKKSKKHSSVGFMEEILDYPSWRQISTQTTPILIITKRQGGPPPASTAIWATTLSLMEQQNVALLLSPQHLPWSVPWSLNPAPGWFVCRSGDVHRLPITRSKHQRMSLFQGSFVSNGRRKMLIKGRLLMGG